jgi:predicted nuclease of predicted toxin-antitoxin system
MRFHVDAHLPRRLAQWLQGLEHEARHRLDLPMGNRTRDTEINDISLREQAIVVTKDADFVNSFTVHRLPYKLLLVSTGNIKNADLDALFRQNIDDIVAAFGSHDFIELTRTMLIIHV